MKKENIERLEEKEKIRIVLCFNEGMVRRCSVV
jgi:hypothetical protein